jgi:hypothetical protein
MITVGLVGCLVAASLVLTLMAFPRRFSFAARYRRVAWLPVAALLIEAVLWKPVLTKLSYFAVIPLLLTCIASLFLTAVGATLVVTARERNEGSTAALRATLIAAIPGMLLLALMLYGFVNAML